MTGLQLVDLLRKNLERSKVFQVQHKARGLLVSFRLTSDGVVVVAETKRPETETYSIVASYKVVSWTELLNTRFDVLEHHMQAAIKESLVGKKPDQKS